MSDALRVVLEIGPKGKKVVASAWDWPGLERNGRTEDDALAKVTTYLPRYGKVVERAGIKGDFEKQTRIDVVERYEGVGSTDFWGISFASCSLDREPIPTSDWDRRLALLRAGWTEFDDIAARVSPELRKGPRGGGRDRDDIVRHVFGTERGDFAKKLGVRTPEGVMLTPEGLKQHRDDMLVAFRAYHREGGGASRTWTLSYLLRHTCYHVLDHAWEMEDRDFTGEDR